MSILFIVKVKLFVLSILGSYRSSSVMLTVECRMVIEFLDM